MNIDKKEKKTRIKKTETKKEVKEAELKEAELKEEQKEKKKIKRVKKANDAVKIIEELKDKDNHSEDNDETGEEKKEPVEKESNIVTEKLLDIPLMGEEKEVYGYLIIQEFPHINTTYVIGSKPFGKIWFDYTEVLEQFITILIDWQVDFDNKEIIHSKKPKIVKIRVL